MAIGSDSQTGSKADPNFTVDRSGAETDKTYDAEAADLR
jgi:hypothetical protein